MAGRSPAMTSYAFNVNGPCFGFLLHRKMSSSSAAFDASEIRHHTGSLPDLIEQLQPVLPQVLLIGTIGDVDRHLIEERVNMWSKLGHGPHGRLEVSAGNCVLRLSLG